MATFFNFQEKNLHFAIVFLKSFYYTRVHVHIFTFLPCLPYLSKSNPCHFLDVLRHFYLSAVSLYHFRLKLQIYPSKIKNSRRVRARKHYPPPFSQLGRRGDYSV